MLGEYPKEIVLQDGFRCMLRPMTRDDQDALYPLDPRRNPPWI
jgi:hypothetical protein